MLLIVQFMNMVINCSFKSTRYKHLYFIEEMFCIIIVIFKCLQGNQNNLNVTSLNKDNHVLNSAINDNSVVRNIKVDTHYCEVDDDDDDEEGDAIDMDAFVESGLLEDDDSVSLFYT